MLLKHIDTSQTVSNYYVILCSIRTVPLIIMVPTMEALVGIDSTNKGCWCIPDFFNLRPDDGVSRV